jgi:hypothetical protein
VKVYTVTFSSSLFASGRIFKLRDMQDEKARLMRRQETLEAQLAALPGRIKEADDEIKAIGKLIAET